MENQFSVFRKNDVAKLVLGILIPLILVSFTGYGALFIPPIMILVGSFYIVILISRKMISEKNTASQATFVSFFGILLSIILLFLLTLFWNPTI